MKKLKDVKYTLEVNHYEKVLLFRSLKSFYNSYAKIYPESTSILDKIHQLFEKVMELEENKEEVDIDTQWANAFEKLDLSLPNVYQL